MITQVNFFFFFWQNNNTTILNFTIEALQIDLSIIKIQQISNQEIYLLNY